MAGEAGQDQNTWATDYLPTQGRVLEPLILEESPTPTHLSPDTMPSLSLKKLAGLLALL